MEKRAEREMEAIRKLLRQGMKSLSELTATQAELATSLAKLAASQKETDRLLKAFIRSRSNGNSGNGKKHN
jgi:hypothetical protein